MSSIKTTPESIAENLFRDGLNCAQSVIGAFPNITGASTELVMQVASGFGGGMGKLQLTCGAATGAFMIIGLSNSMKIADEQKRKHTTAAMIQEFYKRFVEQVGTSVCAELLGHDLNTGAGRREIARLNFSEKICAPCVKKAVSILLSLGIGD